MSQLVLACRRIEVPSTDEARLAATTDNCRNTWRPANYRRCALALAYRQSVAAVARLRLSALP